MEDKYFEQERELLINYIDQTYLPGIKDNVNSKWKRGAFVEIIVNPACNQQCEYCYIHRYGTELYPLDTRTSKEGQLKHLKMFLDYTHEHKILIPCWEIYGGDLFHDGIFWDILDMFFDYYTGLFKEHPELKQEVLLNRCIEIICPNNMSYFYEESNRVKFKEYWKRFEKNDIMIGMSWSTDGKYCTDTREKKELDDEYWDTMLTFVREIFGGVHPMISYENIEHWKDNYDWWIEMFKKYGFCDKPEHFQPPMLEVRNSGWTDDKLEIYKDFLTHMFNVRLNHFCEGDIRKMAYHYFVGSYKEGEFPQSSQMDPLMVKISQTIGRDERMSCAMQDQFDIVLGDLAIVPCHRTAYEQFRGGYFKIENDKIVDIIPKNVTLFIASKSTSIVPLPKCFRCPHRRVCIRGCFGAQYEYCGEMFLPIPDVCKLLQTKYNHIIKLLNESGVLQCAMDNNYLTEEQKDYYLPLSKEMGYEVHG